MYLHVKQREEKIYQLNSTSFYTYTPTLTTLFVNCEKGKQEKYEIEAYNIIQLKPGCKASINKHIFSSGIEIEQATNIKQTNIKLHLKEILDITEDEEKDFIKLLEEEQTIGTKPVTIIDVKKKYDLHILSKKNHFITKLFGSISTIITLIILTFIGKYIWKKCRKTKIVTPAGGNTFIKMSNITPPDDHIRTAESTCSTTVSSMQEETGEGVTFSTLLCL